VRDKDKTQVIDEQERDFYIMQRLFVKVYGKIVGPFAGVVYNSLQCHANADKDSWPSAETIAKEWDISAREVLRSILKLEALNIITVDRRHGIRGKNRYHLIDKKKWCNPQVVTHSHQSDDRVVTGSHLSSDSQSQEVNSVSILKESISHERDDSENEKPPKNKPSKKIGPQVNYPEEINKQLSEHDQETQLAIKLFLDGVASGNKSGGMTQRRYLTLLCELSAVSATTSKEAFRQAVQKATKNSASSIGYIKTILQNKPDIPKKPEPLFAEKDTEKPRPGYTHRDGQWYRIENGEQVKVEDDQVPDTLRNKIRKQSVPTPVGSFLPTLLSKLTMSEDG
jgi:hypothetical protein